MHPVHQLLQLMLIMLVTARHRPARNVTLWSGGLGGLDSSESAARKALRVEGMCERGGGGEEEAARRQHPPPRLLHSSMLALDSKLEGASCSKGPHGKASLPPSQCWMGSFPALCRPSWQGLGPARAPLHVGPVLCWEYYRKLPNSPPNFA